MLGAFRRSVYVTRSFLDRAVEVHGFVWANVPVVLGGLICCLVLTQLVLTTARGVHGLLADRSQFRLQRQLLQLELQYLQNVHAEQHETAGKWHGLRKFRIEGKVVEATDTVSLYLAPHDGRPIPDYMPGQHLTIALRIPGVAKPVVRCYSLSDASGQSTYRITVRKASPPTPELPAGQASSYLVDATQEGDILDCRAPNGSFVLDLDSTQPIVLIAAGVGITPLLAMLNAVVKRGTPRVVHLFYGVRNRATHAFRTHLNRISDDHPDVHVHTFYSQPSHSDRQGDDFDAEGRVSLALLRQRLPSNNFAFYLCGPPAMLDEMAAALRQWGVPAVDIHVEAFGAGSIKVRRTTTLDTQSPATVQFTRSEKLVVWDGQHDSLLELAESQGIPLDAGCRAGNCGTCVVALKAGRIVYPEGVDPDVEEGSCLACVAVPVGVVEVDA